MNPPYLSSFGFEAGRSNVAAEFGLGFNTSLSFILKNPVGAAVATEGASTKGTVSIEGRYYFPHNNGAFASLRVGNSGNVGIGCGIKLKDRSLSFVPRLGMYWNNTDRRIHPVFGIGMEFGLPH